MFLEKNLPFFLHCIIKSCIFAEIKERKINMDAHELNTWLILGTLFLLCLVGLGIGIYDTIKQKKEKSLSA